jgi:GTP-binding protein
VGLVGLPNAGKSTLLGCISGANPKVASYPFTTLAPHLGLVERPGHERFIVADIPGLIEGAHDGTGLGIRFLRHVERTRLLVHLVDGSAEAELDPVEAYRTIRGELEAYGQGLAEREEIVVLTKSDLPAKDVKPGPGIPEKEVHRISAVTGEGVEDLLAAVARRLGCTS